MKSALLRIGSLALVALVTSGCSDDSPDQAVSPSSGAQAIAVWLEYARESGKAGPAQIAQLENLVKAGEVTRADVDEANSGYFDCLDAAGLEYTVKEETQQGGVGTTLPVVYIKLHDPDGMREPNLEDACHEEYSIYVASAYWAQPSAVAVQESMWTSAAMKGCLAARGFPSGPDSTVADMQDLFDQDVSAHGAEPGYHGCKAVPDSTSAAP